MWGAESTGCVYWLFSSIRAGGRYTQVPYQIMRAGPAILGGLIVPIMYLTVIELGGNNVAACIAAFMLLFGMETVAA